MGNKPGRRKSGRAIKATQLNVKVTSAVWLMTKTVADRDGISIAELIERLVVKRSNEQRNMTLGRAPDPASPNWDWLVEART